VETVPGAYWAELKRNKDSTVLLKQQIEQGTVTSVYAARDEVYNGAVALKEFLERGAR